MRAVRLALVILPLATAACAQLPPRPQLPVDAALPPGASSQLDQLIAPVEVEHPGESGFVLLKDGPEAFVVRARTAQLAGRSIDVQTYIWHADLTGTFLALQLVAAADRGVNVRLLLDDMDARARNAGFAALDAHPRIAVRMFNPFASREGVLGFIGEGLTSFDRINHRMHNKSWIADNRIAIVGGRNLGDEYFGANDGANFVDLDFAMVGGVVRDASASFDRYWNSPAAYPMSVLDPDGVSEQALEQLRRWLDGATDDIGQSRYAEALREDEAVQRLLAGNVPLQWTARYQFVADDPLKAALAEDDPSRSKVIAALLPHLQATQRDLSIVSPYFVPGESGTQALVKLAQSGKSVSVLTNSLAANDVAAVHGGYSRHRKGLLEGGVALHELKPVAGATANTSLAGSSGASLHTKALVIDDDTLFVGSYNLDPRSTMLNCEQGVLVENPVLAGELRAIIERQTSPERAWSVTVREGELNWTDGTETFDEDPDATWSQRFQAWFARTFRLDAQL
ncbi:MAG TPA: phospholipase D family protein [Steroidobacteraceae bacterium]|nr:phospholipase D family protein [Steroidobacteraceae bacterium]